MLLPTQVKNNLKHHKSSATDRFDYINRDNLRLAIPIGPRFQAEMPEWNGPPHNNYLTSPKWLGTVIWSPETKGDHLIGKGRPESCNCASPGSIFCVKRHISEKSSDLQKELGPAFQKWKFDEMGEAVAKLWKQEELQKLTLLMTRSPLSSQGTDFLKPALECFPLQSTKTIVSYYFNVYVPRRMSMQTRSGCIMVDTDDEEKSKSKSKSKTLCSKGSKKKAKVNGTTLCSPKLVKTKYMVGRR